MAADAMTAASAVLEAPPAGAAASPAASAGERRRAVRSWGLRLLLLAGTTVLPLAIGKIAVPLDWYVFRCWEALIDYRPRDMAAGPFYANQTMRKVEVGDLGVRSRYAVPKRVEWQTDAHGYRNRPAAAAARYGAVLVGRSDVAGSSLTQGDILAEALARRLGRPVYGYAPATMGEFLREPRFLAAPPAAVVFVNTERGLYELAPLDAAAAPEPLAKRLYGRLMPAPAALAVDRMRKKPWLSAHLWRLLTRQPNYPFIPDEASGMLFYEETLRQDERHRGRRDVADRTLATILAYRDAAAGRGLRFLFMPVPDKETVYWDLIPPQAGAGPEPPPLLPDLLEGLRHAGVEVVDLAPAYRRERETTGRWMYHLDDTHWNALGVAAAAELLARQLEAGGDAL